MGISSGNYPFRTVTFHVDEVKRLIFLFQTKHPQCPLRLEYAHLDSFCVIMTTVLMNPGSVMVTMTVETCLMNPIVVNNKLLLLMVMITLKIIYE